MSYAVPQLIVWRGRCVRCGNRKLNTLDLYVDMDASPPGFELICRNAPSCTERQVERLGPSKED